MFLILVTRGIFAHCEFICNVFVVMSCVLSRLDFDRSVPSMFWCMLLIFGLFGSRLVVFAVRASVLCFVMRPSLQVLRAGTMVERFTARMHVVCTCGLGFVCVFLCRRPFRMFLCKATRRRHVDGSMVCDYVLDDSRSVPTMHFEVAQLYMRRIKGRVVCCGCFRCHVMFGVVFYVSVCFFRCVTVGQ